MSSCDKPLPSRHHSSYVDVDGPTFNPQDSQAYNKEARFADHMQDDQIRNSEQNKYKNLQPKNYVPPWEESDESSVDDDVNIDQSPIDGTMKWSGDNSNQRGHQYENDSDSRDLKGKTSNNARSSSPKMDLHYSSSPKRGSTSAKKRRWSPQALGNRHSERRHNRSRSPSYGQSTPFRKRSRSPITNPNPLRTPLQRRPCSPTKERTPSLEYVPVPQAPKYNCSRSSRESPKKTSGRHSTDSHTPTSKTHRSTEPSVSPRDSPKRGSESYVRYSRTPMAKGYRYTERSPSPRQSPKKTSGLHLKYPYTPPSRTRRSTERTCSPRQSPKKTSGRLVNYPYTPSSKQYRSADRSLSPRESPKNTVRHVHYSCTPSSNKRRSPERSRSPRESPKKASGRHFNYPDTPSSKGYRCAERSSLPEESPKNTGRHVDYPYTPSSKKRRSRERSRSPRESPKKTSDRHVNYRYTPSSKGRISIERSWSRNESHYYSNQSHVPSWSHSHENSSKSRRAVKKNETSTFNLAETDGRLTENPINAHHSQAISSCRGKDSEGEPEKNGRLQIRSSAKIESH